MEDDGIYPGHACQWDGRAQQGVRAGEDDRGCCSMNDPITADSVSPSWYKRYLY